jgi:hypothetical protein
MEPKISLQEPATCLNPEPDQSSLFPHLLLEDPFLISSHLRLGLPSGPVSSGLHIKTLYAPLLYFMHATCHAHLSLLDLINRIVFGEE